MSSIFVKVNYPVQFIPVLYYKEYGAGMTCNAMQGDAGCPVQENSSDMH